MSRDIRYRAWDKTNKKMDYNPCDSEYGTEYIPLNSVIRGCQRNGLILQQFTGLQDCNGVDIYEGDLLKIDEHYGGDWLYKESIQEVVFIEAGFDVKEYAGEELSFLALNKMVAVVGNVFEGIQGSDK